MSAPLISWGMRTFQVRKPKVPEVIVRENSGELTLRAEEVETSKADFCRPR